MFFCLMPSAFAMKSGQPAVKVPDSVCTCRGIIQRGSCGKNVRYTLDNSNGILTISGVGNMANYAYPIAPAPWKDYESRINKIIIEDGVTSIGDSAFTSHSGLTSIGPKGSGASVEISDSVISIGVGAFTFCDKLINVTIPESVTWVGEEAFLDCGNLTSITIPKSVIWIGSWAFASCDSLTNVTIPENVVSIENWTFLNCDSLNRVNISEGVTSIRDWAFAGCKSLTSVTIPESVTSIGDWAFSFCKRLTSVTIPESVTSIGDGVFFDCSSLTIVTIPESVIWIGERAFANCNSLNEMNYCGLTNPKCASDVFASCRKLIAVKTPKDYRDSVFCGKPVKQKSCKSPVALA